MVVQPFHKPVRRTIKTALFAGTVMLACAATSGAAWAGPTTGTAYLNQISSSGIGTGSQGTVTLTQNGADEVDVTVTLASGAKFVNTGGPHTPFAFNLDSGVASGSTLVNITPNVFVSPSTLPSNFGDTPYGNFNFAINYTGSNGGGNGNSGPLSFAVTNTNGITIGDFNTNTNNYYFAADVLGTGGSTGAVAANSLTTSGGGNPVGPPSLPEPGSLVLLGTGLVGLGVVARRKRRRA